MLKKISLLIFIENVYSYKSNFLKKKDNKNKKFYLIYTNI